MGEKYNLPRAICPSLSYYLWGTGNFNGEIAVTVGISYENLCEVFYEVKPVTMIESKYAASYETNIPVYVCHNMKYPVTEVWAKVRSF